MSRDPDAFSACPTWWRASPAWGSSRCRSLLLGVWPGRVLEEQTRSMSPEHPLGLTRQRAARARHLRPRRMRLLPHAADPLSARRHGAIRSAHAGLGDALRLSASVGHAPHRTRPVARRRDAFGGLAFRASVCAAHCGARIPSCRRFRRCSTDRRIVRRQEARDLLAYLETLGRARELAGPEGEAHARAACNCPDDEMAQMAFHAAALNANPAQGAAAGRRSEAGRGSGPGARAAALSSQLRQLPRIARRSAMGPALRALHPRPANLAEHEYTLDRLGFVLWNGVAGTAMPAWRDLPADDLAAIAQVVRGFHAAQQEPTLPANIVDLGARVYTANCVQCHGERGAGDGSAVGELRMLPADFRGSRPSLAESLRALRNGVEGTQMAPWTEKLSEAELSAVAYYVRGFFQAGTMITRHHCLLRNRICRRVFRRVADPARPARLDRAAEVQVPGKCAKL